MPRVVIYSTTTCPYCKMEKVYLDSKHIPYKNNFVDLDESAAAEMVERSGQRGVPFNIITKDDGTEEHILGFNQEKIDSALGLVQQ